MLKLAKDTSNLTVENYYNYLFLKYPLISSHIYNILYIISIQPLYLT